jgi:hypothetical protein
MHDRRMRVPAASYFFTVVTPRAQLWRIKRFVGSYTSRTHRHSARATNQICYR